MPSPSREKRICAMADAYIKTVSRNYARNLDRAERNRRKHSADEPVEHFLELLSCRDDCPSNAFVLYADGYACTLESETLYDALLSLSEKERTVLLLGFWRDFTDKKIAKQMEVTERTVYNLRRRAFHKVQQFYEARE